MMRPSRASPRCLRCLLTSATPKPAARRLFHAASAPAGGMRKAHITDDHPPLSSEKSEAQPKTTAPPLQPQDAQASARQPPPTAPKAVIDIRHIRQNVPLHEQNCRERNYGAQAAYPARIAQLFEQWQARQREGRALRERSNLVRRQLANPATARDDQDPGVQEVKQLGREALLAEARRLKGELAVLEADEAALTDEMERLALTLPNLTSAETPRGDEPLVLSYINDHPEPRAGASDRVWRSHVHIGAELGLLDFAAAAAASGWGWYYLLNEGAQLEQALVQYALTVARRYGWAPVSPPSVVYSHVAAACGFQPRDRNAEQQIYTLAQSAADAARGRPELCLAATAEIPLAAMRADAQLEAHELPLRRAAVSRCYRAEAGGRGVDTKGLYRVHEFTKVELFAWTSPDPAAAADAFDELLDMQTEILQSLGLHCRVLEMPSADLGASAFRKVDMEAFFPSRRDRNGGWGEVTSASVCTDYQARRLATRLRLAPDGARPGGTTYPWTINGTALAVPRVLAALLENGWDEADMSVAVPACLRPWMDGREKIGGAKRSKDAGV